ncbi:TRIC cation channel family protein [Dactylosporangium sp. NBC_01737]|uniref:trimeric intracellular cation channel family protein n=1 Tax=Dactylosporangium sp. NBC_01737 TaxID=2975959 RepID=UPI002E108D6E|nr:TRIC cation channel family protein [Dactylosporangium sp. NBC_01737]
MSVGTVVDVLELTGLYVLATFGALMAVHKGFDVVGMVVLAMPTALGGGVLRDITARETPALVQVDTDLYAIPAAAGATVIAVADRTGMPVAAFAVGAAVLVFAFRVVAMLRHWTAPRA